MLWVSCLISHNNIGSNSIGQLGTGNTVSATTPVAVDMSGVLKGQYIVDVKAGMGFAVALSASGRLFTWGNNTFGNLSSIF